MNERTNEPPGGESSDFQLAALSRTEDHPENTESAATPRRSVGWVFLGPQGLRAGWSILLFLAILAALFFATGFIAGRILRGRSPSALPPAGGLASELWQFSLVVVATWVMSRLERRPLLFYGYQGGARGVRLFSGAAWGFAAISGLVFGLKALGYLSLDGVGLSGESALRYAVLWGCVFLLVGFFEESLFRGYLQYTLTRGMGFWWGALIFAVVFGAIHRANPGESPVGLFSAGAVGLVFCLSLWYTGSLWWAVGFHAAWDWGQSYFYGTATSSTNSTASSPTRALSRRRFTTSSAPSQRPPRPWRPCARPFPR